MDYMLKPRSNSGPIVSTALVVGSVSFVLGFVGPLLFSDSNLGPLLGIFVTGPLGLLAGALIGIVLSARRQNGPPLKRELGWLAGVWGAALLFTLAAAAIGIGWISIGAQLAVLLCAATLLYLFPGKLPGWVRRWRPLILAGASLTILSSMFPPLDPESAGEGRYAFFLDPRFDASTKVPDYTVHEAMLLMQWLIIAAVVAVPMVIDKASNRTAHD
jgi:hypothetical protein